MYVYLFVLAIASQFLGKVYFFKKIVQGQERFQGGGAVHYPSLGFLLRHFSFQL